MKVFIFSLLLLGVFDAGAQEYPPEWVKYTFDNYFSAIESDCNNWNWSELDFKNYLADMARSNLAKQIEVRVQDSASLTKRSVNGYSAVDYKSESLFSTDVNLKMVETRTLYDPETKRGYAIACINKISAGQYYSNEISSTLSKIENSIAIADTYIETGFKGRAKAELESKRGLLGRVDESLFWLDIFGQSATSAQMIRWRNDLEQTLKAKLAELAHSTAIVLSCSTEIFGERSTTMQNSLKGELSKQGCNFVADPSDADWVIHIKASARKYSQTIVNGQVYYFSYVDAHLSIDKQISSQRIYEDAVSVKGGHILGYRDAAHAACKELSNQLGNAILKSIQQ